MSDASTVTDGIAELERALVTIDLRNAHGLSGFADNIRNHVGGELSVLYCPVQTDHGFALSFLDFAGFSIGRAEAFATVLARSETGWGVFNPTRPEPTQRNLAHELAPMTTPSDFERVAKTQLGLRGAKLRKYVDRRLLDGTTMHEKVGLTHHRTARVLICDGSSLLGYLGIFDLGRLHDARECLQTLVPSLHMRLAFEAHFETQRLDIAAMNGVPAPVFIARSANRVDAANAAASAALERAFKTTKRAIDDALQGRSTSFTVLGLRDAVDRRRVLVGRPQRGIAQLVRIAARRWDLTRRESQVLSLLAEGKPNKIIANTLGCTPRTIEFHVGGVLRKAGLQSRAEIIAALARMA